MKKRMRLSGDDIQFINQLRNRIEPVYEVTNGKEIYRPTLTKDEILALQEYRRSKLDEISNVLDDIIKNYAAANPELNLLEEFDIDIQFKHKKKRYVIARTVK